MLTSSLKVVLSLHGFHQALADISNGLMRDPRVFHLDCSDWFEKYNKQGLLFPCQLCQFHPCAASHV
jgi:hypothetical protein